jgi:uncharacterized protein
MRLLCDEMLGGLARWLRAAGHDTALAQQGMDDQALLAQARAEERLLLTRDRSLAAAPGAMLLPGPLDMQAVALARAGLDWRAAPFARCLVDNAPLRPMDQDERARLPGDTAALPGPFRACPACGRLYWPGSHVRRMAARLRRWSEEFAGTAGMSGGSQTKSKEIKMIGTETKALAVVTGGSSGIGYELAKQFVDNGYDVLIAAESDEHLAQARAGLSAGGAVVETHASDLSTEAGVESLYRALAGRPVDILCVNAGVGLGGPFAETELARELKMIDLNVRGAVQLTKLVLKDMVARDSGKLLFTSSIAATHPDPFEAVYGATKVFLRWFGEALRNELKDTGIGVTVLMPSVTDTNFFNRADMMDTNAGTMENKDDPAVVAKSAYDALMADKHKVIPTLKNKVIGAMADMSPAPVGAQVHRALAEPGSGKE